MGTIQSPFVSLAFSRLRSGVNLCCWITGLALVTQLLVWCVTTFMDVRYEVLQPQASTALIVSARDSDRMSLASEKSTRTDESLEPKVADPNRILTKGDRMMSKISTLVMGAGNVAVVFIVPLLALGVVLGAGSATPGVERSVSAFKWSLIIAVLVLPLGQVMGLPWHDGALTTYAHMSEQVDLQMAHDPMSWGGPMFYARFAVMPMACVVGLTIVGMRFSYAVSAGIIPKENMRLDPVLEKEAANIVPASLHSGRTGNALKVSAAATATVASTPAITQVLAGDAPRRLI